MLTLRAAALIWITVGFTVISLSVIVVRLVYRGMKRTFDLSDVLITIALISTMILNAINIDLAAQWGAGRHKKELPKRILESHTPFILLWLNQIFFKVASLCAKLSLVVVYHRLFSPPISPLVRWTRNVNLANGFVITGYYFSIFLVTIFQCHPLAKIWDSKRDGTCVNLDKVRFTSSYVNIITSGLLVTNPLPVLFRIKHKRRQITELTVLIMLGCVHTGCAICRLLWQHYPEIGWPGDYTWKEAPVLTIAQGEINIALIACSLVVMQPIVDKIYCSIPFLDVSMRGRRCMRSGRRQIPEEPNSDNVIYGINLNAAVTSHQIWGSTESSRSTEGKTRRIMCCRRGRSDNIDDLYDDDDDTAADAEAGRDDGRDTDDTVLQELDKTVKRSSKINVTTEFKMENRNRSSIDG